MTKVLRWIVLSILALIVLSGGHYLIKNKTFLPIQAGLPVGQRVALKEEVKPITFGFSESTHLILKSFIQRNQFFSDLILEAGHLPETIHKVAQKANDFVWKGQKVASDKRIIAGKPYALIFSEDSCKADYLVYQPDMTKYILFSLKDTFDIQVIEKKIDTVLQYTEGVIESSLWASMVKDGAPDALIDKMEDALGWTVDFQKGIHKGDVYKAFYETFYIEGQPSGVGRLYAGTIINAGKEFTGIHYESSTYKGYFDHEGRTTVRQFLKAPVKGRISSKYSLARFHPIRRKTVPHFGTDYAAPHGTPIYAVAHGTVTVASRTSGNGNFVKIRHDNVYETQYLHMSRFAQGVRAGTRVTQGQVIGYVGSTGLATGPHVCFRFWKNGKQIDHTRLNFPPPNPMSAAELDKFKVYRDSLALVIQNQRENFLAHKSSVAPSSMPIEIDNSPVILD